MRKRLVICRHTRTDYNDEGRYSGQLDVQLNATGLEQGATLAKIVGKLPNICGVVGSDLSRTAHLARAIAVHTGGLAMLDERLREVHVGNMESLTRDEAASLYPDPRKRTSNPHFDLRSIGGEKAFDVIMRQMEFIREAGRLFDRLRNGTDVGRLVVVGHGTALRLLFVNHLGVIDRLHDQGGFQEFDWPF